MRQLFSEKTSTNYYHLTVASQLVSPGRQGIREFEEMREQIH